MSRIYELFKCSALYFTTEDHAKHAGGEVQKVRITANGNLNLWRAETERGASWEEITWNGDIIAKEEKLGVPA